MRLVENESRKVNVLLVEIVNRNLGDTVIADNAEYVLKKAFPLFSGRRYSIYPYNIYDEDYALVSSADLIVFAGGGIIKYKREDFYLYICRILEVAEDKHIPVFFNAVGVEGYDENDERCQMLKRALNHSCVKGLSVRDDLSVLTQHYLCGENCNKACEVADPAVFTRQVYHIDKSPESNVIGLGIVRYRIFEDHGIPEIDRDVQLQLWTELIQELERRGYVCRVFVNGLKSDFDFAKEVLAYAGRSEEEYLVQRPVEARELVQTIAGFRGIIAGRMHSNIIAYALGIPSVGLVWNEKLAFWGEKIGYPERFVRPEDFQAKKLADVLEQSLAEGIQPRKRRFYQSTIAAMRRFLRVYGQPLVRAGRRNCVQKTHWEQKLVAVALGGRCSQFNKLNDGQMVEVSYNNGFRLFEADVRLTSDGKLVCINGWTKGNYQKLGLDPQQYDSMGMTYEEFMQQKWYGYYPVMDFAQLMDALRPYEDWKLMVDLGKPGAERMDEIIQLLESRFAEEPELLTKLVFQVQTEYAAKAFMKSELKFRRAYYLAVKEDEDREERIRKVISLCRKNKIKILTASEKVFDADIAALAHKEGLKVFAFSYHKLDELQRALDAGADWVGTYYMNVNHLRELIQERQ